MGFPPRISIFSYRSTTFYNKTYNDVQVSSSTVECADAAYDSALLTCYGCSGNFAIPASCPVCSPASLALTVCSACDQGSYGGGNVSCELCPNSYTTVHPNSTSVSDCVPITDPPTLVPTNIPSQSPSLQPSAKPSTNPTPAPTTPPSPPPTWLSNTRSYLEAFSGTICAAVSGTISVSFAKAQPESYA